MKVVEIMRRLQKTLREEIEMGRLCGPFYAAIVDSTGAVVAEGANSVVDSACSNNHAEMNVIARAEKKFGTWNLAGKGLTLFTTAEPCMMCVGGILWSGLERVVYGVSTEAVERITGFDEGFKANWREEFASRGIRVTGPILSELGEEVLSVYMKRCGIVYSPSDIRAINTR